MRKPNTIEDFWRKVDIRGPQECWSWQAGTADGYGLFKINGRMVLAHRYSYELVKGPVPDGLLLLHSCDNRKCVNPDHLTPGTHLENMRDMAEKGRSSRGERHHSAKLSASQVLAIREQLETGGRGTVTRLAREFGVSHQVVSKIGRGEIWTHLPASFFAPSQVKTN